MEELIYLGEKVSRVVVGQVKSAVPHPDSDHMKVCVVDCGEYGHDVQIVTGAPNVFEGMKTPVALDGSTVCETNPAMLEKNPDGVKKIKKGKLRGVESCGMLCSGEELGINDDFYAGAEVDGLLVLDESAPVGEDIRRLDFRYLRHGEPTRLSMYPRHGARGRGGAEKAAEDARLLLYGA